MVEVDVLLEPRMQLHSVEKPTTMLGAPTGVQE